MGNSLGREYEAQYFDVDTSIPTSCPAPLIMVAKERRNSIRRESLRRSCSSNSLVSDHGGTNGSETTDILPILLKQAEQEHDILGRRNSNISVEDKEIVKERRRSLQRNSLRRNSAGRKSFIHHRRRRRSSIRSAGGEGSENEILPILLAGKEDMDCWSESEYDLISYDSYISGLSPEEAHFARGTQVYVKMNEINLEKTIENEGENHKNDDGQMNEEIAREDDYEQENPQLQNHGHHGIIVDIEETKTEDDKKFVIILQDGTLTKLSKDQFETEDTECNSPDNRSDRWSQMLFDAFHLSHEAPKIERASSAPTPTPTATSEENSMNQKDSSSHSFSSLLSTSPKSLKTLFQKYFWKKDPTMKKKKKHKYHKRRPKKRQLEHHYSPRQFYSSSNAVSPHSPNSPVQFFPPSEASCSIDLDRQHSSPNEQIVGNWIVRSRSRRGSDDPQFTDFNLDSDQGPWKTCFKSRAQQNKNKPARKLRHSAPRPRKLDESFMMRSVQNMNASSISLYGDDLSGHFHDELHRENEEEEQHLATPTANGGPAVTLSPTSSIIFPPSFSFSSSSGDFDELGEHKRNKRTVLEANLNLIHPSEATFSSVHDFNGTQI